MAPCSILCFNRRITVDWREVFHTLLEVRVLTEQYRQIYNRVRPHSSLGYRPLAPLAILPAHSVPLLAGLTLRVLHRPAAGHDHLRSRAFGERIAIGCATLAND